MRDVVRNGHDPGLLFLSSRWASRSLVWAWIVQMAVGLLSIPPCNQCVPRKTGLYGLTQWAYSLPLESWNKMHRQGELAMDRRVKALMSLFLLAGWGSTGGIPIPTAMAVQGEPWQGSSDYGWSVFSTSASPRGSTVTLGAFNLVDPPPQKKQRPQPKPRRWVHFRSRCHHLYT